jgi:hypothetical protein
MARQMYHNISSNMYCLSRCIIMPLHVTVQTGPILSCFLRQNLFSVPSVPQSTFYLSSLTWSHNNIWHGKKWSFSFSLFTLSSAFIYSVLCPNILLRLHRSMLVLYMRDQVPLHCQIRGKILSLYFVLYILKVPIHVRVWLASPPRGA